MEFVTPYSTHEETVDAIKGVYGKDIGKDYKIVYLGNAVIAIGPLEKIERNLTCSVKEWTTLGSDVYLGIYGE